MRQILTITDAAVEQIKYLMAKRDKPTLGIKVEIKTKGCSGLAYKFSYVDFIGKYDEVIDYKDVKVVIQPEAVMYLIGSEMDYVTEQMKESFVFTNPNEKGRCGCGESFHV